MLPSLSPRFPPPFYERDEYLFQDMCRDLMQREEGISTCYINGPRGTKQYGIDIRAYSGDGSYIEVGQCKRYEKFTASDIQKASDEFFEHWEYWNARRIRRFILFVACVVDKLDRLDEIERQKARFNDYQIRYEVWDAHILRNKLALQEDITKRYIEEDYWVNNILGKPTNTLSDQPINSTLENTKYRLLDQQLENLSEAFSTREASRLDEIREVYRNGKPDEAYRQLQEFRNASHWLLLKPALQAKVLRTLGVYEINLHADLARARSLAKEAAELDPTGDDLLIRVVMRLHESDYETALSEIEDYSTITAFNLKLFLLLESGQAEQVLTVWETAPIAITPDAESKRIHALALLSVGQLPEARREITAALSKRPRWVGLRAAAAMIDYYSALSPAARPSRLIFWPTPTNFVPAKSDEESIACLQKATETFAQLIVDQNDYVEERRLYETWHLACLAMNPIPSEDSANYCCELLAKDAAHHRALLWAIGSNIDGDYSHCEQAVKEALSATPTSRSDLKAERVIALAALYFYQNRFWEAQTLLTENKAAFLDAGGKDTYEFWQCQALLKLGEVEQASLLASKLEIEELRDSISTLIHRRTAIETGNHQPLITFLEERYRETGDGEMLLELCSVKAELGDWVYVESRAEELVLAIGTASVARFCMGAAWLAAKPARYLYLLTKYQSLFPQQSIPADLRQAKIVCLLKTGDLTGAANEAKALVAQSDTTSNLMMLFNTQHYKGDLAGMAATAHTLVQRDDLPAVQSTRLAALLNATDSTLARDFWNKAVVTLPEDPELIGFLGHLSFQLNLEKEGSPLRKQAYELAEHGEGIVRKTKLFDVQEMMRKRSERVQELDELYGQGEIPLPLFAQERNIPLVEFLYGQPQRSRKMTDLRQATKVFVRHGGRPAQDALIGNSQNWKPLLDITTVMLADDLGLLDLLEQHFAPLCVSPHLPLALQENLLHLLPQQASELDSYEQILALLEAQQLSALTLDESASPENPELKAQLGADRHFFYHYAKAQEGVAIDYFPLTSHNSEEYIQLPDELAAHVTNCHGLVESLHQAGRFTDAETAQFLRELGSTGTAVEREPLPPVGSIVVLCGNIASNLAKAGLLEPLCRHFKVLVDANEIERGKATQREFERRTTMRQWLKRLIDRIDRGLSNGTYRTATISDNAQAVQSVEREEEQRNRTVQSWEDLLLCEISEDTVLVIDDRMMNRFQSRDNKAPIITLLEVMQALRLRRLLEDKEYYAALLKMRAGNLRYLPLESDEILYHLNQTKPDAKGEIVETAALSILRRYQAGCRLNRKQLRIPPLAPDATDKTGELDFVLGAQRASQAAIIAIWADSTHDTETVWAQSDWVFRNLHISAFGLWSLLPNPEQWGNGLPLIANDISGFLLLASQIVPLARTEEDLQRRRDYFHWLDSRLLQSRLKADPDVLHLAADNFRRVATSFLTLGEDQAEASRLNSLVLQSLFFTLPSEFQEAIAQDSKFLRHLLIQRGISVTAGRRVFQNSDFNVAIEHAFVGEPAPLKSRDPEEDFTLVKISSAGQPDTVFNVIDRADNIVEQISDPVWELASPNLKHRQAVLWRHRYLFDCEDRLLKRTINRINQLKSTAQRVARTQQWQEESLAFFYIHLERKLLAQKTVTWGELIPPSPSGMLRHLRLDVSTPSSLALLDRLDYVAQTLLKQEGLTATLERLTALPIKLPQTIITAFFRLDAAERQKIIDAWQQRTDSPISRLHLIDLVCYAAHSETESATSARELLDSLYDEESGKVRHRLFRALLCFLDDEFGCRKEFATLPTHLRLLLLWSHASRVHDIFHRTGFADQQTADEVQKHSPKASPNVFSPDLNYNNDVLHPRHFRRKIFLTHVVAAALSKHKALAMKSRALEELLTATMYQSQEERSELTPEVLADPLLATNLTGSWLGGDRGLTLEGFIEVEKAALVSSPMLREYAQWLFDELMANPTQAFPWQMLFHVVGTLPIYPELRPACQQLIQKIDLCQIYDYDSGTGCLALFFVAGQLLHLHEQAANQSHFEALLYIARKEAAKQSSEITTTPAQSSLAMDRPATSLLFEAARLLSVGSKAESSNSQIFFDLLQRMFDIWPALQQEAAPGMWALTCSLPLEQQIGLWSLVLSHRASHQDAI